MSQEETQKDGPEAETVAAGVLAPWTVGDLPKAPVAGLRQWAALLGPGVLLAGASIGSGEWLAGPGVTAQYGGTLLWVATLSIIAQVFCNLEMMRYTLYCGEPILVGAFRTRPGPRLWTPVYMVAELGHIWPYNVASAAVPVAAAMLGHLPGDGSVEFLGISMSERGLVSTLGVTLFLLAFVPLIFGGTVYKTLERLMTFKLIFVLIFLSVVSVFFVSGPTAKEVVTGFFRIGAIPLRAETVIDGRHFTYSTFDGEVRYTVRGTVEESSPVVTQFQVKDGNQKNSYQSKTEVPEGLIEVRERMVTEAVALAKPGRFLVEQRTGDDSLTVSGTKGEAGVWIVESVVSVQSGNRQAFSRLEDAPDDVAEAARELTDNRGVKQVQLLGYISEHGRLPDLDWALIAVFASIAGAGGLTNVMLSHYARDKGWGMGARVGAIASAVGGRKVSLSHVGQTFRLTDENRTRWKGWVRHIVRDQAVVWLLCCFVGMALPCMMSLEFIRNAPVAGDRVAAMTADGIAHKYPGWGLWGLTLFVGFLVLYPGQIMSGDTIPRRWCDILWTASSRVRQMREDSVKYIYYGIMSMYLIWGVFVLVVLGPLGILKIAGVLMNLSLGIASLHTLYVNRTLLPKEFQPGWFMQLGLLFCSLFFFAVSGIVLGLLL